MDLRNPQSTAKFLGHPIHPMLVPFPIGFLVGAWLSDVAYWQTGDPFFATASAWLIGLALIFAAMAAVAGLTDFLGDGRIRALSAAWRHMIGNVTAVLLSLVNFVIRLDDPAAAIVWTGLALSTLVALILVYTGWQGGELVYRHRVAIPDEAVE